MKLYIEIEIIYIFHQLSSEVNSPPSRLTLSSLNQKKLNGFPHHANKVKIKMELVFFPERKS